MAGTFTVDQAFDVLTAGVESVIAPDTLRARLDEGRPLRIKAGFDPTAPDLHLGHAVLLNKLRQFQQFGHRVLFLIGDFTASIGDPTGKSVMRQPLTAEQIATNAQTYSRQVFRILDPAATDVVFNSTWMGQMSAADLIGLAGKVTVARMLERDDFSKRYRQQTPIGIHEFLYPLIQGWDSVALQADVELGGTDQTFNLLMGRQLQEDAGQSPQIVMTLPILEGLDGHNKMSKSLGNFVALEDPPADMFGKLMSVSDELMWRYLSLLSKQPAGVLEDWRRQVEAGLNPRDIKLRLAREMVDTLHGAASAERAQQDFVDRFQRHRLPRAEDLPLTLVPAPEGALPLPRLLKQAGLVSSTSEALRVLRQGGVRIGGERVVQDDILIQDDQERLIQVGKRRSARVRLDLQGG